MLNAKPEIIESLEKELSFLKELLDDAISQKDFLEAHRVQKAMNFTQGKLNKILDLLVPNQRRNQYINRIKHQLTTKEELKAQWKKRLEKYNHSLDRMPSDEHFEKTANRRNKERMGLINHIFPEKPEFQIDTQIFEELIESLIQNEIAAFILWLSEKRGEKIRFSIKAETLFIEVSLGEQKLKGRRFEKLGFTKLEEGKLLYQCQVQTLTEIADLKQRISVLIFNEFDEVEVDSYFEVF